VDAETIRTTGATCTVEAVHVRVSLLFTMKYEGTVPASKGYSTGQGGKDRDYGNPEGDTSSDCVCFHVDPAGVVSAKLSGEETRFSFSRAFVAA
jgi:hypothetical protein